MSITAAQLNEIEHNVFVTHASTLEQEASTLSIDDIRSGIVDTRRVQRTVLTKLPEQAFSMAGNIDSVVEKAQQMSGTALAAD